MSTSKAAQSEATRAKLLTAARELFGERGYAAVGTEEVVRAAGVTRGALYHQFADKQALFRALVEQVEMEVIRFAGERMDAHPDDLLVAFKAACRAWLEVCAEPDVERILLVDAPAVLGLDTWREIGEQYGIGVVKASLEQGMASGALRPAPVDPLAHVIIGALDEAALYVARAADRDRALRETGEIVERLLDSLAA
ncbi:MAG: TetR/AcrR family transcriptional regulator [Solirubrobacteraceae bacterium]